MPNPHPRTEKVSFKVRPHERAALEAAAERSREPLAQYVRRVVLSSVRRELMDELEPAEEVAAASR